MGEDKNAPEMMERFGIGSRNVALGIWVNDLMLSRNVQPSPNIPMFHHSMRLTNMAAKRLILSGTRLTRRKLCEPEAKL